VPTLIFFFLKQGILLKSRAWRTRARDWVEKWHRSKWTYFPVPCILDVESAWLEKELEILHRSCMCIYYEMEDADSLMSSVFRRGELSWNNIIQKILESKVLTKFWTYVRTNRILQISRFLFALCTTLLFSTCQKAAIVFFTELLHNFLKAKGSRPCMANPEGEMKVSTHVSFELARWPAVWSRNSSER
jgi:hypothetical protein